MTTPGVPMVFAGDELGLEGAWGEDARRTMPWGRPETWDGAFLAEVRALAALRRARDALARGGLRYVHVSADAIAFLRETRERAAALPGRAARRTSRSCHSVHSHSRRCTARTPSDGVLPGRRPRVPHLEDW